MYVSVLYNGSPSDPRESENDIALSILKANAGIESWACIEEAPYTNKVTVTIS